MRGNALPVHSVAQRAVSERRETSEHQGVDGRRNAREDKQRCGGYGTGVSYCEDGGRSSKRGALELTPSQEFMTKKDAPTINSEQITHEKNLA